MVRRTNKASNAIRLTGLRRLILLTLFVLSILNYSLVDAFSHWSGISPPVRFGSTAVRIAKSSSSSSSVSFRSSSPRFVFGSSFHTSLSLASANVERAAGGDETDQTKSEKRSLLPCAPTVVAVLLSVVAAFWGLFAFPELKAALHGNEAYVWTAVSLLSSSGVALEDNTTVGKALSAPLVTMAAGLAVANFGLLPFASPVYDAVNRRAVPLAVPLLLFDSDLRRVVRDTGTVLAAFFAGAVSTIVGTLVTVPLVSLRSLPHQEGWKIAAALMARHIGGAVNFVAVAETLQVTGTTITAAIAADNVVVALYFAGLFFLAESGTDDEVVNVDANNDLDASDPEDYSSLSEPVTLFSLGTSLTAASALVWVGELSTKLLLPPGTSSLPLVSVLTVCCATAFPSFFRSLRSAGTCLGVLFMQYFFAASGAAGSIALVLRKAPSLFLFSTLQIAGHFVALVALGRTALLRAVPRRELYLASNANVGGPTTAAAMARAKNWPRLVLPALLVGTLGYSCATAVALSLCPLLRRMIGA